MSKRARNIVMMVFGVAAAMLFCGSANAASFDCKKAASRIEKLICDDVDANYLDGELETAFLGAMDRSNHPDAVRAGQRAWLKDRDACADAKCLDNAYRKQITTLSGMSDEPTACSGDTTLDINACGAEYSRRADLELARYVAASRKRIMDDASDRLEAGGAKTTLAAFDKSQVSWAAYRKAECDAIYEQWSDGTIRGAMYNDCWLTLTKARSNTLWSGWLTFMDSTPPLLPKPSKK